MLVERQMISDLEASVNRLHKELVDLSRGQKRILEQVSALDEKVRLIVDDIDYLHNEAKIIATWHNAKGKNSLNSTQAWYDLTKNLHEYFAEELKYQNDGKSD
jgi:hypothetical protein